VQEWNLASFLMWEIDALVLENGEDRQELSKIWQHIGVCRKYDEIIPTAVRSLKQNILESGNLHRINDSEIQDFA
jgi:hypothetical protein